MRLRGPACKVYWDFHRSFPVPETPNFNWGRRRAMVRQQLKWLLPLVFCWSDPDVPRWDLGAVTSERCSAIVGLTNGSGLVARVNQHNGFPVMRSLTGEVKPISRDSWSDLCIRSHIVSVKSFRLQSGVVVFGTLPPCKPFQIFANGFGAMRKAATVSWQSTFSRPFRFRSTQLP